MAQSGLPIGVSNSSLGYALISYQTLQKKRERRNARFGLSSTLTGEVRAPMEIEHEEEEKYYALHVEVTSN